MCSLYNCHILSNSTQLPVLFYYILCVCVCVVMSFILDVRLVDAPAGVTQEEGYTGFFHLPSAVLGLVCIARRILLSLSLVDREVEFYVRTNESFSICWVFLFYFILLCVRKIFNSCYCTEIRTHVPTSEGFEVTN